MPSSKRGADLVDLCTRALAAICKALRPEDRPIMAGDDDATTGSGESFPGPKRACQSAATT